MRTLRIVAPAALATVLLAGPAAAKEFGYFHTNYAEAEKVARKEGKPLYLHFTTTWCGWCRKIENEVYKVEGGKQALSDYVCATLDCTVPRGQKPSKEAAFNMALMRKYGGGGYPFLAMTNADGILLHKVSGYRPLPKFKEELVKSAAALKEVKKVEAELAALPADSFERNQKALDFYSSKLAWEKAAKAAEALKKLDPKFKKANAALVHYALLKGAPADTKEADRRILEDQAVKHDPTNAAGYMERILMVRAQNHLRESRATKEAKTKQAHLQKSLDALELLIHKAKRFEDEANAFGFLGYVQTQLGNNQAAIAALEKSIGLDPASRRSAYFKTLVERLKKPSSGGSK